MGDGFTASFASLTLAMEYAIALQRAFARRYEVHWRSQRATRRHPIAAAVTLHETPSLLKKVSQFVQQDAKM
jgi:hypothetical protein